MLTQQPLKIKQIDENTSYLKTGLACYVKIILSCAIYDHAKTGIIPALPVEN